MERGDQNHPTLEKGKRIKRPAPTVTPDKPPFIHRPTQEIQDQLRRTGGLLDQVSSTRTKFAEMRGSLPIAVTRPEQAIYQEATELLQRAQSLFHKAEVGVREATWVPRVEYPDRPIAILLATDIHFGSLKVDYPLLNQHLKIVEDTPNFFMVSNGDDVDNFNPIVFPSGMLENPLPPQLQSLAMMEKIRELDAKDKLGVMSFGNHNDFMNVSGLDWFDTFARGLKAPLFNAGGFLHIMVGDQRYGLAMTHRYWGTSKLNPTNACKRFWEHEYPQADITFLGHTHQSEMLHWERGGKQRLSVIGGTYKSADDYARKRGIGGRSGQPGHCVVLFPNEHRMIGVKDIEIAQWMVRK